MHYLSSSKDSRPRPDFYGSFTVEFTNDADTSKVPMGLTFEQNLLLIEGGWYHIFPSEIEVIVGPHEIVWTREEIRVIRDTNGDVLWMNPDYEYLRDVLADALAK